MLALKKFESLKIPASCYGLWQDHASSVDSLKYSLAVYSSCDLSDKDWRQSLWSQLLVHTKKIDFNRVFFLIYDYIISFIIRNLMMGQKNHIHVFKIAFIAKITSAKSHSKQESHFQNRILSKNHIFKNASLAKITFSKSHF